MVEVESYELRRYLPMPYEAALGPRLLRVQGRAEEAAGWQETCPELLRAVGARLRAVSCWTRWLPGIQEAPPVR